MVKLPLVLVALGACAPDLEDATSIVTSPRLLAVRIEAPEVAPGGTVETIALWADPTTTAVAEAPLEWAFCTRRKGFSEPGPVASACLAPQSEDLVVYGAGTEATGTVPANACRQFGPDAPDAVAGEPPGRPVDPDGTGGFYQPLRVRHDDAYALGQVRLRCGLPGATPAQATAFRDGYIPNANPAIDAVELPSTVRAGEVVELTVAWKACEDAPCTGSEPYLWFDPSRRELATRREAMRVSWFATAGAFETGHAGRSEAEADQAFATGTWTAPTEAGDVQLWIVLRDDRGGVTWTARTITVGG